MAIWTNPDGSQLDIPDCALPTPERRLINAGDWRVMTMPSGEHLYVQDSPGPPAAPLGYPEFLRKIGSRGGRARARRHSRDELSAWGRKRGSKRPASPGSAKAPTPLLELSAAEFRQHLLQLAIPPSQKEYLRQIGRKGGLNRAARHSSEERREWARLGGLAKAKAALQRKSEGARPTSQVT